jgi:hypothetical protein
MHLFGSKENDRNHRLYIGLFYIAYTKSPIASNLQDRHASHALHILLVRHALVAYEVHLIEC